MKVSLTSVLAIIYCLIYKGRADETAGDYKESQQKIQRLLQGYDHRLPPPASTPDGKAVLDTVHFMITQSEFENEDTATIVLYVRQEWQDRRLALTQSYNDATKSLTFDETNQIWKPHVGFTAGSFGAPGIFSIPLKRQVHYPSVVRETRFVSIEDVADMSNQTGKHGFRWIRFSTTTSGFRWAQFSPLMNHSARYDHDTVRLYWRSFDPIAVDPDEVELTYEVINNTRHDDSFGKFSCLRAELTFEDQAYDAAITTYFPTTMLVMLSWLQFWIPLDSMILRSFSAILPFHIFAHHMSAGLVDLSQGAVQVWFGFCLIYTFLSFAEFAVTVHLSAKKLRQDQKESTPNDAKATFMEEAHVPEGLGKAADYDLDIHSRWVFPLVFILFVALYLVLFLLIIQ